LQGISKEIVRQDMLKTRQIEGLAEKLEQNTIKINIEGERAKDTCKTAKNIGEFLEFVYLQGQ